MGVGASGDDDIHTIVVWKSLTGYSMLLDERRRRGQVIDVPTIVDELSVMGKFGRLEGRDPFHFASSECEVGSWCGRLAAHADANLLSEDTKDVDVVAVVHNELQSFQG